MPDIFISYSSHDREQADLLTEMLTSAGLSVWIDKSGIEAATSWSGEITKAINDCKIVVLLLSTTSIQSENVRREVSLASERKKKILPIELESVNLTDDLAYHLAGIQRTSFDNFEAITRALQNFGLQSDSSPSAARHASALTRHFESRPKREIHNLWYYATAGVLVLAGSLWLILYKLGNNSEQGSQSTKKVYPQAYYSKDQEATQLWIRSVNLPTPDSNARVVVRKLLENAISLDSNFALAYSTLAGTYLDDNPPHFDTARKLLQKAMVLEPTMAASYSIMAEMGLMQKDSESALEAALRGLSLSDSASPTSSDVARICYLSKHDYSDAYKIEQAHLRVYHDVIKVAHYFVNWLARNETGYARTYFTPWTDSLIRRVRFEPENHFILAALVLMLDLAHDRRFPEYYPQLEDCSSTNLDCSKGLLRVSQRNGDESGRRIALQELRKKMPLAKSVTDTLPKGSSREVVEAEAYIRNFVE